MCAWGSQSSTTMDALFDRIRRHELTEVTVLPTKIFGDEQVFQLVQILNSDENNSNPLRSLSASGHKLSEAALLALGEACCSKNGRIESLAIGDSTMGNTGVQALLRGLTKNNNHILSLDLSNKGITNVIGILSEIAVACPNIQILDLSHNHQENLVSSSLSNQAQSDRPYFAKLENLNLSDCHLNAYTMEVIINTIISTAPIKILNMSQNSIGDTGTQWIGTLKHLHTLHLSNCNLSNNLCRHWPSLQTSCHSLDLSCNAISDMSTLATFLQNCHHLQDLCLAGNPIIPGSIGALHSITIQSLDLSESNCGIEDICASMQIHGLKSLRLFHNNLGNSGFQALATRFKSSSSSTTLEILDLAGNQAEPDAVNEVLLTLCCFDTALPALSTLILGGNKCNRATEELIRRLETLRPKLDVARDKF